MVISGKRNIRYPAGSVRVMKRIAVDIATQILGKIFSSLIGLLAITQMCRYLTVEDFGGYTLAFSFLSFFHPVVDMGLNTIASREIARDPAKMNSMLSGVLCLKIILAAVAVFLILCLINLLGYPLGIKQLILLTSFSLFNTVLGTLEVVLIVNQRLFWLALSQVLSGVIFLLIVYVVMAFGQGISALIAAQIFSVFISYLIILVAIKGSFCLKKPTWLSVVSSFSQALPLGITSLLVAFYFNIDVILLSKLMDARAVAYYGSAYRLLSLMIFIPHAVMMSLFPILTRSRQQGPKALSLIFTFSFYLLMLIGVPVAIWVTCYSRPIVELIYSNTYQPAVSVFRVLVWAGLAIFASHLAGYTLVVMDKQKFGIFISFFALVSNVCLNLWLIPHYGIDGAAIATVITEFAVACLGFGLIFHFERMIPFSWKLNRVLIFSVATSFLAVAFKETNWIIASGIFVTLLASFIVYCFFTRDRFIFVHIPS